uniref:Uncharacterized protein n=1 Tax=Arundo donax TaxID=35708 RepID=A0A0A9PX94_ARUDO
MSYPLHIQFLHFFRGYIQFLFEHFFKNGLTNFSI